MLKEAKIAQLHKLRKDVRTLEERYWLNKIFMMSIVSIMPILQ